MLSDSLNLDSHPLWKHPVLQEKILPPAGWSCTSRNKIKWVPPHPSLSCLHYLFLFCHLISARGSNWWSNAISHGMGITAEVLKIKTLVKWKGGVSWHSLYTSCMQIQPVRPALLSYSAPHLLDIQSQGAGGLCRQQGVVLLYSTMSHIWGSDSSVPYWVWSKEQSSKLPASCLYFPKFLTQTKTMEQRYGCLEARAAWWEHPRETTSSGLFPLLSSTEPTQQAVGRVVLPTVGLVCTPHVELDTSSFV